MQQNQTDFHEISSTSLAKRILKGLGPVPAAPMFQTITKTCFVHALGTQPNAI